MRRLVRGLGGVVLFAASACQQGGDTAPNFTIAPDTASLLVGQSIQLTAVNAPTTASWSSDNAAVATVVPQTGFVQAVGRGDATITASTGSSSARARIHVTVPPAIGISTPTVSFDVTVGDPDPAAQTVTVTNAGDGTLGNIGLGAVAYGQGETTGWLTVSANGTGAPVTLTLAAKSQGLARGTYTAIVPVTAPGIANSPQNIAVTLHVQAPASMVLSQSAISLIGIPNSTAEDSIAVTNGGDRPLTGLTTAITYTGGSAQNWLTATVAPATAPATLRLVANIGAVDTGRYFATVRVSSNVAGVAAQDLAVTLVVGPGPSITLSRTTVAVAASIGQNPAPQTVSVTNGGGGALSGLSIGTISYAAGQPTGWLAVALGATTAPATLTLTLTTASLGSGAYSATFPLSSPVASNSPVTLTVTLTVGPPPAIALNPSSVTFSGWAGGTLPGQQPVQITNSGGGTLGGLSISIAYGAGATGWLSGTFQSGTTAPTTLLLQPKTTSLSRGTYTATVTVSSSMTGVASKTVGVSYTIQSFSADAYPLFSNTYSGYTSTPCKNCHYTGGQAPNLSAGAAQTQSILVGGGYVTPGNDAVGTLVCKITGGSACGTPMLLPSGAVSTIKSWIRAGAPP